MEYEIKTCFLCATEVFKYIFIKIHYYFKVHKLSKYTVNDGRDISLTDTRLLFCSL